ncbi:MAG: hypothetical protein ACK4WF_01445 [Candidatus Brocadiales bacterium]
MVDELRDDLDLAGFETEVALSSLVAFTILEERKMDLAIVGGGNQAISNLHRLHTLFPKLPIIFLSEQRSKRYQSTLLKGGASAVLGLPPDKDRLIAKVEQIVEKLAAPPTIKRLKKLPKKVSKKISKRVSKKVYKKVPKRVSKKKKRAYSVS